MSFSEVYEGDTKSIDLFWYVVFYITFYVESEEKGIYSSWIYKPLRIVVELNDHKQVCKP